MNTHSTSRRKNRLVTIEALLVSFLLVVVSIAILGAGQGDIAVRLGGTVAAWLVGLAVLVALTFGIVRTVSVLSA